MADTKTALNIQSLISNLRQQSQATNPYTPFASSILQADTTGNNTGETVGYSLAKSLLGGLALKLGQNSVNDDVESAIKLTPSVLKGGSLNLDDLDSNQKSYVTSLQALMADRNLENDITNQDRVNKFLVDDKLAERNSDRELKNKQDLIRLEKPWLTQFGVFQAQGDKPNLDNLLGSQASPVSADTAAPTGQATGQNSQIPKLGIDDIPDSPFYQKKKDTRAEEDAARKDIAALPSVQKLNVVSTALAQLKNIKDIDTSSSDIPFATLFIGGLDGSVVREGEYARVQGANPFLDKFRNQLEGALNGKSSLGVDIKKRMYQELIQTQKGLVAESTREATPRLNVALGRGAKDQQTVLPFDPNMQFDELQTGSEDPIPTGRVTRNGQPTFIINGVEGVME